MNPPEDGKVVRLTSRWPSRPVTAFLGHDWSEVADFLGVSAPPEDEDDPDGSRMQAYMARTRGVLLALHHEIVAGQSRPAAFGARVCVGQLRRFVGALERQSEGLDFCTPAWRGLQLVEDDATFLQFFIRLLDLMWT